jgi:phosphoribosylglycinamide formyltransferase 2
MVCISVNLLVTDNEDGDYRESWQPQVMSEAAKEKAREVAGKVVNALVGFGIFGVELFVKGDDIIFNEVSPRPHDTGLVTLISQELSEFALHVRAFTVLPINQITQYGPCASTVILGQGTSENILFEGVSEALNAPQTQLRLFGKPDIDGRRRLGVVLTRRDDTDQAISDAVNAASKVKVIY